MPHEYLTLEKAAEHFNSNRGKLNEVNAERLLVHAIDGGLPLYEIMTHHILSDEQNPKPLYRAGNYAPVHPDAAYRALQSHPEHAVIREVETGGAMQDTLEWYIRLDDLRVRTEDIAQLIATSAAIVETGAGTSPSGDNDKKQDATGQCYWRVIVNSNIKKMDKPKKASVREIIKYLRDLNDTRLPNRGGQDELIWIDDMGTEQRVKKKTVSNAASDARKLP